MTLPTAGWLAHVTGGSLQGLPPAMPLERISIDTRSLKSGGTFWALEGTRNGHDFVDQAFASGARAAVVSRHWVRQRGNGVPSGRMIEVPDTRQALTIAASLWRDHFTVPFLGVTGSNGKTSTKELILQVLGLSYRVAGTRGNLNNDLGVPLTLLSLSISAELAVIEMGASHVGEIAALCRIARPTHGLVTSIGKAHLEGFGSPEAVRKAKGELYDWLGTSQTAFIPVDDLQAVRASERNGRKVGYGFSGQPKEWSGVYQHGAGLRFDSSGFASFRFGGVDIRLHQPGRPPALAALAALTVGAHFAVPAERAAQVVAEWRGFSGRGEILNLLRATVIDDSYNANPDSMRSSLETLSYLRGNRRVAILGDMNELGLYATDEHRMLGAEVKKWSVDLALFVGNHAAVAAESALSVGVPARAFVQYEDLAGELEELTRAGDVILVKGSRSVHLERAVKDLISVFN